MDGITIRVDRHEQTMLTWLANRAGLTAEQLLAGFVGDLCGSAATGGSDERRLAFAWYKRRFATDYIDAATALAWRAALVDDDEDEDAVGAER